MGRFEDQVVWITGGGSGIGRALALQFHREGAAVAVSGRRAGRLDEVVAEIEAGGGRGLAVICDVTREDDVAAAVRRVVDELGRLDVAVANAGFSVVGKVEELSVDDWRRQFDTNVFGLVATARHAIPALRETRGRLVLVGSVAAFVSMAKLGPYNASKYAVRAVGDTLVLELQGSGVSVTTVHPAFVESEIAQVDNEGRHDAARPDRRPRKLMWTAAAAAAAIVRAVHRRRREVVLSAYGKLAAGLARHAPGLLPRVLGRRRRRRVRGDRPSSRGSEDDDRR